MAAYKSKGIVLRSIRYGEADRILDLYTRDSGLVSAIAKGIRRTRSRFGARLEPLSCVDFLAYQGRTLDTLTQAETLRSFHGIREDLARFEELDVDEVFLDLNFDSEEVGNPAADPTRAMAKAHAVLEACAPGR